ncbi:MAG: PAS domain S-box protein [Gemmatimonadetes bacterium]|nr:PAS domain S-box protein [Gemmatimonadota bacterium]
MRAFRFRTLPLPPLAQTALLALAFAPATALALLPWVRAAAWVPVAPDGGLALGLVLRLGAGALPGLVLGSLAAHLALGAGPLAVPLTALQLLGPVVAAVVLRRLDFDRCFTRVRDALAFGRVTVLALLLTALARAALLTATGTSWPPGFAFLATWTWLTDLAGAIVVAPLVLMTDREALRRLRAPGAGVFAFSLVVATVTSGLVFCFTTGLPVIFLVLPVLGWAAIGLRGLGGAIVALVVAVTATAGTALGRGPFAGLPPVTGQLLLACFIVSTTLALLGLMALFAQKNRAQERAELSEARLRLALASSGMGIWDWDLGSGRVEWSDGHAALLGLAPGQFEGSHEAFMATVLPEDRPRVAAAVARSLEGREPYAAEFRVRWPDGSVHWMAGRGQLLGEREGRPTHMIGVLADVTERAETLQAVERAADRLRIAMTLVRMGTWELDVASGRLDADAQHHRLFGFAEGERPSFRDVMARVHPGDVFRVEDGFDRALRDGHPYSAEFRIIHPGTGATRWLASYSEAPRRAGGPARVVGVVQDITERKSAEATLRAHQLRLEGIVNSAMDGIVTVDEAHRIVVWNRAAEQIFHVPWTAAIGHPLERFLPMSLAPGDGPHFGSLEGRRGDGELFPLEASVARIRVEDRILFTITVRDLTEQTRAEEARQRLERQLRQAQRMEAVGTLASGIAHDFNNVLGAILGNVELARLSVPADHPATEALVQITSASLRARDLVRGLLAFTRRHDSARAPTRVDAVTEEVLRLLRASLPPSVTFQVTLAPGLPPALADASELHQVIMNLCTNAAHAMQPAGGTLGVELEGVELTGEAAEPHPALAPGRYLRLAISDTGVGMDAETLERIFDPFFTTKPPGEGTGLGLAVVHGIVRSHGGAITVSSRQGAGSCFRVYLPALPADVPEPVTAPAELPRGNGECLLFVDDEAVLVAIARRALERLGYRVTALTDPREAVALVREEPGAFDLLLTDLTMPSMSGTELAAELLRFRPDLPIIMITGYSGTVASGTFGIRELLQKPTTLEQLASTVHRVLHHTRAAASAGGAGPAPGR